MLASKAKGAARARCYVHFVRNQFKNVEAIGDLPCACPTVRRRDRSNGSAKDHTPVTREFAKRFQRDLSFAIASQPKPVSDDDAEYITTTVANIRWDLLCKLQHRCGIHSGIVDGKPFHCQHDTDDFEPRAGHVVTCPTHIMALQDLIERFCDRLHEVFVPGIGAVQTNEAESAFAVALAYRAKRLGIGPVRYRLTTQCAVMHVSQLPILKHVNADEFHWRLHLLRTTAEAAGISPALLCHDQVMSLLREDVRSAADQSDTRGTDEAKKQRAKYRKARVRACDVVAHVEARAPTYDRGHTLALYDAGAAAVAATDAVFAVEAAATGGAAASPVPMDTAEHPAPPVAKKARRPTTCSACGEQGSVCARYWLYFLLLSCCTKLCACAVSVVVCALKQLFAGHTRKSRKCPMFQDTAADSAAAAVAPVADDDVFDTLRALLGSVQ